MNQRGRRLLFVAGTLAGLALAAWSVIDGDDMGDLPEGAAATVNGRAISREAYLQALAAVAADKKQPLSAADEAAILERLIEEQLLIDRALALDLPARDAVVRKALTRAMIDAVVADEQAKPVSEADLRAFYEANPGLFRRGARYHVGRVFVAGRADDAAARRAAIEAAIAAGQPLAEIKSKWGDGTVVALPDGPVPAAKLKSYLAPKLADAVLELAPGQWTAALETLEGWHYLKLIDRREGALPTFDAVRDTIEHAYRTQRDDAALRRYLDELKRSSDIARGKEP